MEKELLKLYESLDDEKCKDLFARQLIICHRHMHMHMDDMWGLIGDALRGLTCNGYCPEPSKPGAEKPTEPEQPTEPGTEQPTEPGTEQPTEPGTEKPTEPGTEQPSTEKPTPDQPTPDAPTKGNGTSSKNGNTGYNPRPDLFRRNF
ncbi:SWPV2-ORF087 [Shearwaterpox virus]|uniref:SWPV2-ORF087 n=1 Tax=Shearwaterpox virus TaxID=1974596 RepID=A0A1V0QG56_CNPV|nr:SWPV2-ORF087 [Shearwaterpox virus]